ncbi:MAG: hypothetical protein M3422_20340, partial [Actinomycetota bacterium]|nr:hypothetical protein [Actinomycetota bacterium]
PSVSAPELTSTQADRLDAMLDEVDDTLAAIDRELGVRPKEGVHVEDKERRAYIGCAAGKRVSGAMWRQFDVVYAEVTRYDDLGPTADAIVDAAAGWEVTKREEYVDTNDNRGIDLELRSGDGSTTLTIDVDFWLREGATDGVQLHVTSGQTECVAVDAE